MLLYNVTVILSIENKIRIKEIFGKMKIKKINYGGKN